MPTGPAIVDVSGAYLRGAQAGSLTSPVASLLQGGLQGFTQARSRQDQLAQNAEDEAFRQAGLGLDTRSLELREGQFAEAQAAAQAEQEARQQNAETFNRRLDSMEADGVIAPNDAQMRRNEANNPEFDHAGGSVELREELADHILRTTQTENLEEQVKELPPHFLAQGRMILSDFQMEPGMDFAKASQAIAELGRERQILVQREQAIQQKSTDTRWVYIKGEGDIEALGEQIPKYAFGGGKSIEEIDKKQWEVWVELVQLKFPSITGRADIAKKALELADTEGQWSK